MIIIKDSREQKPFDFSFYEDVEGECIQALKTGDYTLFGYEDKITIDRKQSVDEIAHNVFEQRFERECQRMENFEEAYILCEFSVGDLTEYVKNSKNPNRKLTANSIFYRINQLEDIYKVKFIFSQNREEAQEKLIEIFRNVIKKKN